ncbi:dihydroxyacetone kinase subunit DhaL [Peribacillus frigoritolerans]|uniref:dihydroxyacetone kinase subunit DhaL n=1 Tax=Peribacillus frigoritolerans TaxID=450367 RepID=UPI003F7F1171
MKQLTAEDTRNMLLFVADQLIANKEMLCEIDGKIGDGDHGFGIERGFKAVKKALEDNTYLTMNTVYRDAGMAMLRSMGGASGVIFSRMFLGADALPERENLDSEALALMMREGLEKVKSQGKAQLGDKTMVDAFEPAVLALEKEKHNYLEVALNQAVQAADAGVEETKHYPAKFGRAKFVFERSIGEQDAGATSVSLIFKAMHDYISVKKEQNISTDVKATEE